jgi:hypothetical protein
VWLTVPLLQSSSVHTAVHMESLTFRAARASYAAAVLTPCSYVTAVTIASWKLLPGVNTCAPSNCQIAASLCNAKTVVLLQYESGATVITIGFHGTDDGPLMHPCGVTFTADGDCILVADCGSDCVSKFSAVSGDFTAHVATHAANGMIFPREVLQCEDGSILMGIEYRSHCVIVQNDKLQSPEDLFLRSFELQKIE